MAQQHNGFYPYPPRNSEPRTLPTELSIDWPTNPTDIPASTDMARNGSKDSGFWSAATEVSDDSYYQKHSPAASVAYNNGSPSFYDINALSAQQYQQYTHQDTSPTLTRSNSAGSYSARTTISSLGWTEENLKNSYKFVIPKGREPFFKLIESSWLSSNYPDKVFLDSPKQHNSHEFPCMLPGCDARNFKRPADLERHYRNVHGPPDQKDNRYCDYLPCKTRGPFTRKDHFRDHLRDYHKEDIGSMKRSDRKNQQKLDEKKWQKLQAAWIEERKIESKWWRCPKCLERIQIADSGYDCPSCKHPCDRERMERIQDVRATKLKPAYAAPTSSTSAAMDVDYAYTAQASTVPSITYPASGPCAECGGTGWFVGAESWDSCPSCVPPMDQEFNDDPRCDNNSYASSSRY